ncbi:P-loop containing nucleoside triphosphate hydrolase protein, partial [Fomitopsis serialis]|uniref:P-loop containing nucleoside triphosphate hydrolase protein n=1 Tax=Fomitopsis serialis TaxID=139415 RepID=UPI002007BA8F
SVMGRTGTGKTTFVNTATGSHLAVGSSLSSQTRSIQLSRPVKIDSKRVILIDTPGLDMTTKSTEEVVQLVGAFLTKIHDRRRKGTILHGTIYLHRISDGRMGHVALESLVAFRTLCAQEALTNVAIVLSMWEDVNHSVRETRKYALCTRKAYFRPIMDAGAVIFHHDRTAKSAREIVRHLVANAPQPLQFSPDI